MGGCPAWARHFWGATRRRAVTPCPFGFNIDLFRTAVRDSLIQGLELTYRYEAAGRGESGYGSHARSRGSMLRRGPLKEGTASHGSHASRDVAYARDPAAGDRRLRNTD